MSKQIRLSWIATCGQSATYEVPDDFKGESASEVFEAGQIVSDIRIDWVDDERDFEVEHLNEPKE